MRHLLKIGRYPATDSAHMRGKRINSTREGLNGCEIHKECLIARLGFIRADVNQLELSGENVRECFAANGVAMSYEHVNVHVIEK